MVESNLTRNVGPRLRRPPPGDGSAQSRLGLPQLNGISRRISTRNGMPADIPPGWLARLLTHRVAGLEEYQQAFHLLTSQSGAIKVLVEVASLK